MRNDSISASIKAAFNLGVWIRKNAPADNVFEAGMCLRETIFYNIDKPEGGAETREVVNANIDYLLEIALLGYLMSGVCSYDEAVKNRIPELIENRLVSETYTGDYGAFKGEVSETKEWKPSGSVKTTGIN
ncbi:MAG TPA: hypothetical protein PKC29_14680 [Thermodesulfobacteriota bacterium]|nr:hypothetical protein [Thermodesulfobacteriota bacterium]